MLIRQIAEFLNVKSPELVSMPGRLKSGAPGSSCRSVFNLSNFFGLGKDSRDEFEG
jgi:hypothetical protein